MYGHLNKRKWVCIVLPKLLLSFHLVENDKLLIRCGILILDRAIILIVWCTLCLRTNKYLSLGYLISDFYDNILHAYSKPYCPAFAYKPYN